MQLLKQVDPNQWEEIPPLAELYSHLPRTMRCSTKKDSTIFRKKSKTSEQSGHTFAYVGYNPPNITRYIIIDLDYDTSIIAYAERGLLPRPQIIVKNPVNGHSHYIYQLKDPVTFYAKSRSTPIRLLRAVELALTKALGGDRGFTGHLAKNALSDAHDIYVTGTQPYTLGDLAEYLELDKIEYSNESMNDDTYGRNTGTFNVVRAAAYKLAGSLNYTQLYNECLSLAIAHNATFVGNPMNYNEVKSIAKSIAGYCKSKRYQVSLSALQAKKGAKGGKKSKRKPVATSVRTTEPWKALNISRATYYRDLKTQTRIVLKNETS